MPKKYSKKEFDKDLKELTKLINEFKTGGAKKKTKRSRKVSSGKRKSTGRKVTRKRKTSKPKKDLRTFKIISINGKKIAGGQGRYTGENHSQAAPKACNAACRKKNVRKMNFELMETTRGSDHKVKRYDCERTKKNKPVIVKDKKGKILFKSEHDVKVIEHSK